jgi:twitching motility protein PilT
MSVTTIDQILRFAVQHDVSDIHLKVGRPPVYRKDGVLVPHKGAVELQPLHMKEWVEHMGGHRQLQFLEETGETDFSYTLEGVGRFRINAYQRNSLIGLAMRVIPTEPPDFDGLGLPEIVRALSERTRGLILVTGATGEGKSTTLTAMVDYINETRACHILTIEDPIEFVHADKAALISQREVGRDTASFASALRAALRQDPDVIFIGEMRDLETIKTALHAAETGHLVLSTLHTIDAPDTVDRIVSMFPPHQTGDIRRRLSRLLEGIISQRLVPRKDGSGRVAACEVLVASEAIREAIKKAAPQREIGELIKRGQANYGSQTMDQALVAHFRDGLISESTLYASATNPADVKLLLSGIS